MMSSSYRGLLEEIEIQRNDMVRLASETSLSNHKVIEASKRLDCLLNNYHLLLAQ
jgi:Spo0E like sporulation regulatory protein